MVYVLTGNNPSGTTANVERLSQAARVEEVQFNCATLPQRHPLQHENSAALVLRPCTVWDSSGTGSASSQPDRSDTLAEHTGHRVLGRVHLHTAMVPDVLPGILGNPAYATAASVVSASPWRQYCMLVCLVVKAAACAHACRELLQAVQEQLRQGARQLAGGSTRLSCS
jgi:hypothetical protein